MGIKLAYIALGCWLSFSLSLKGQQVHANFIGSPFITNYSADQYLQAGKNWGIAQGSDGKMYFANNYGIIQFDGYSWERIGQPENQSEIRSFCIHNNRIYIGGTSEIGYFSRDRSGTISYTNLTPLIQDASFSFNDVREIIHFKDSIFFLTNKGMMMYVNGTIHILGKNIPFRESTTGIDELVFAANNYGIFRFDQDSLIQLTPNGIPPQFQIEFILTINPKTYLIGTDKNGVFLFDGNQLKVWNADMQSYFTNAHLNHAAILNKQYLLFGSLHEGLIMTDYTGKIVQVFNEKDGLLDHNILSFYKDKSGNIWTAVDGSVAYLEINSPFRLLNKKNGLRGEIFCILPFQNYLYVGTSRGLYVADWDNSYKDVEFQFIPKTTGQCWQLFEHQGNLLLAHQNGIFKIKGKTPQFIGGGGNWNFCALPNHPNLLLSGNYTGIALLEKTGDTYRIKHQIAGFQETAREIIADQEYVWVGHGYQGVYQLQLSADLQSFEEVRLFSQKDGLPSDLYSHLIQLDEGFFIGTQQGVYQYNATTELMEPNPLFSEILGNETLIRRLIQTPSGNYFTIKDYDRTDEITWIEVLEDGSYSMQEKPFQKLRGQLIPAFESVYFLEEQRILIGAKQGLIIYDGDFGEIGPKHHQCYINEVTLFPKDSVLYEGHEAIFTNEARNIKLQAEEVLHFEYTTSFFEAIPYTLFSTYLEGYDKNWQDWSPSNERNFSQLPPGNYTFWVKSKNIYDVEGQAASFSFHLSQVSNQATSFSQWWLLILGLAGVGGLYLVLQKKHQKHLSQLNHEIGQQQENLNNLQADKNQWQKEKEEINQKLSQVLLQNEIHAGLVQKISALTERKSNPGDFKAAISQYQDRIKEIQIQLEAQKTLETNDFLTKIKKNYPDLSPRELRLCSYLKLNVSSKEIAEYLGISIRGVESLRYRVRKKLGLKTGQDLTEFIINF